MEKKIRRKLPVYLTQEEVDRFFGVVTEPKHQAMFRVLYYLGLRVSELVTLELRHFNFREKVTTIAPEFAKRGVERRIPIPEPLLKFMKHYLAIVGSEGRLFPITSARVWQLCKLYAAKAKLAKNVHPHTFRHSYATQVYQAKHDLGLVADLLGHADIGTTRIYAHLDDGARERGIEGVF